MYLEDTKRLLTNVRTFQRLLTIWRFNVIDVIVRLRIRRTNVRTYETKRPFLRNERTT